MVFAHMVRNASVAALLVAATLASGCDRASGSEAEAYVSKVDELTLAQREYQEAEAELARSEAEMAEIDEETGEADFEIGPGYEDYGAYGEEVAEERPEFDEWEARRQAERELSNDRYRDHFGSYRCTDDCSGHEAGWKDRGRRGYARFGESGSFRDGARAFEESVDERVEELRTEHESDY